MLHLLLLLVVVNLRKRNPGFQLVSDLENYISKKIIYKNPINRSLALVEH
jgi:hypothetical protein